MRYHLGRTLDNMRKSGLVSALRVPGSILSLSGLTLLVSRMSSTKLAGLPSGYLDASYVWPHKYVCMFDRCMSILYNDNDDALGSAIHQLLISLNPFLPPYLGACR